ncbi:Oxidation resistance protein 1 [Glycine soja]|uniref:Oxidation resistance protein 1 n=2 Tax=Glycine subgen. Soja TaxID=1462606 RepID=A0A0B2Q3G4_GLYSO|nr:Oxidation resistance protein 1 [Glycine soja]
MGGFRNKDGNYTDEGVEMKHIVKTPVAVAVARIGDHLPEISEPSMLVSEDVRNVVYASLPALIHGRKWLMLYSTWKHGISLSTLYRRSMFWPGLSLLVVGDRKGAVFGGLVEAPLRPSNKRKYQNIHIKEKIGSGKQSGGLFYLEDDSQQTHKEALVHLASDHTQDKNQQKFWL